MARFVIGQPIKTREPSIVVDAGLEPGLHRFQLEVVTADGRQSPPDVVEVAVVERTDDPLGRDPLGRDRLERPVFDPVVGPVVVPTRPTRPPSTE